MTFLKWLRDHITKAIGICGIIAGCTQNYLESNNIAFLPAKWHGIIVAVFGAITFLVGLYNSIRLATEQRHDA